MNNKELTELTETIINAALSAYHIIPKGGEDKVAEALVDYDIAKSTDDKTAFLDLNMGLDDMYANVTAALTEALEAKDEG